MNKVYLFSLLSFSLFLLNLAILKFFSMPQFFTSYLNDLLCMPVILGICLLLIRKFSKKEQLQISLFTAFSLAALYSVYFEIYLPKVTERYTADPVDALLYFIGAFIFWLIQILDNAAGNPAIKKPFEIEQLFFNICLVSCLLPLISILYTPFSASIHH